MFELNTLVSGIAFGESPRWHDGRLWFADWGTREIIAAGADGVTEVVVGPEAAPWCFDWLPDGRMLIVSSERERLLRREPDGTIVTHADLGGLDVHQWNDIAVDGRGNAYVGNIGFDFPGGEFAPGILAVVTPDGTARVAATGVAFPNGMAVTSDGGALILAESYANRLTAFDIAPDGSLSGRRIWADLPGGYPDGICLDAEGAVWYGDVPNQQAVRVREGGEVLDTIKLDRGCFACALGGNTLYLVATEFAGTVTGPDQPRTGQILTVPVPVSAA
ncbi:MAG TPA: SMP-30/gluconolactonase/LRE family protein [Actinophytocola sp.]|jgi:sugar lactone lactonase YvrE|uniref:SMP-30/gluconolactonase/LRE family protein n=1 Tax=Actinophytocola sp. TaxID=1872138 RepID=UPI002DFAE077|nr:SMP-30/gluconolactonase/LRE family protein [Actinophytocola sp.]